MRHEIYMVNAYIVDANGTFSQLSGYPKPFDSKHYNNDFDKTLARAYSDYHEVLGAMYKADTRQVQVAEVLQMSTGLVLELRRVGALADLPDPTEPTETE